MTCRSEADASVDWIVLKFNLWFLMFSVVFFVEGGRKDEDSYSTLVNTTEDAGKNDEVRG